MSVYIINGDRKTPIKFPSVALKRATGAFPPADLVRIKHILKVKVWVERWVGGRGKGRTEDAEGTKSTRRLLRQETYEIVVGKHAMISKPSTR